MIPLHSQICTERHLILEFTCPSFPYVPKLDLRVEAVYTDVPNPETATGGFFIYWNTNYHDSYTNNKNLLGSWIGREGKGVQVSSTYRFGPKNSIQLGYRHAKVSPDFIPGGETVDDGSAKIDWWLHSDVSLSGSVQYEKWLAPLLAPTAQSNWTSSFAAYVLSAFLELVSSIRAATL